MTEHFRTTSFKEGTKFNLGNTNFYNPSPALGSAVGATGGAQFRLLIDGDAVEKSTMNEIRLSKKIDVFRLLYFAESDAVLTRKQVDPTLAAATSGYVAGIPQLPRRFLVTLGYKF